MRERSRIFQEAVLVVLGLSLLFLANPIAPKAANNMCIAATNAGGTSLNCSSGSCDNPNKDCKQKRKTSDGHPTATAYYVCICEGAQSETNCCRLRIYLKEGELGWEVEEVVALGICHSECGTGGACNACPPDSFPRSPTCGDCD
jgi:hypothetical protein